MSGWREQRRRPDRAARLLGAAEALRRANGRQRVNFEQPLYEATVAAARTALGEAAFAAAHATGEAMTLDEAAAFALADEPEPAQ